MDAVVSNPTEWEQGALDGSGHLVITKRNLDTGEVEAEFVVMKGCRVIISPSQEVYRDGSIAAYTKVERL